MFMILLLVNIESLLLVKLVKSENFIISKVGAGSAGAVISSRLSENGNFSVLLVEAGGYPSPLVNIPLISSILPSTPLAWNYQTEPQGFGYDASVGKVKAVFNFSKLLSKN